MADPTDDGVPPSIGVTMDSGDLWPIYFARLPLVAPNLELAVGQQFESQNKGYLRGLAEAFGVQRGDQRPFHTLKYVGILLVPRRLYNEVRERKYTYAQAVARLARAQAAAEGPNAEL